MKKKVLFSIIGIALFAVAIGFSSNKKMEKSLTAENAKAIEEEKMLGPCGGVLVCDDNGQFCYLDCEWHEGWKP